LLAAMLEVCHAQIMGNALFALPSSTSSDVQLKSGYCTYSEAKQVIKSWIPSLEDNADWVCISQGELIHRVDEARVTSLLCQTSASVVCLRVDDQLVGHREQIWYTHHDQIVGFRRHYEDSVVPVPSFKDWPHRLYIRSCCVSHFLELSLDYGDVKATCLANDLPMQSFSVAGVSHDLNTTEGQLGLVRLINEHEDHMREILEIVPEYRCLSHENRHTRCGPRVIGRSWVSKSSNVSSKAVLISPVVVSEQTKVESRAVLESSIIGPAQTVQERSVVSHSVFSKKQDGGYQSFEDKTFYRLEPQQSRFRYWPRWAYINTLKRAVDIVISLMVLVLFLPIFPVIALAIKLNSPGPIFYKARRQGWFGKDFDCLKFRTMKAGSDQLQDKLRAINEVDGPQFKMADDPRICALGKFLRETYIDEIPQFINVLKGEMSVVGPRPSPQSENTQCPRWRDARLSVRPGVTGLWQLLRTREPLRDFQEWIFYDIDYVKRVSARLDLWICWKTFLQMLGKFSEQF